MTEKATKRAKRLLKDMEEGLRRQLGERYVWHDDEDVIKFWFPGCESPTSILPSDQGQRPLFRIQVVVARDFDWDTPGVANYLLRENATLYWGRFQNIREALVIEQNLFAKSTSAKKLTTVISCLASTALRIGHELRAMGALTVPLSEAPPF